MIVLAELKTEENIIVGLLMCRPKDFKTGSKGFYGNGKLEIDGKRYQTQIQLVEIHSKPGEADNLLPAPRQAARTAQKGAKR